MEFLNVLWKYEVLYKGFQGKIEAVGLRKLFGGTQVRNPGVSLKGIHRDPRGGMVVYTRGEIDQGK